MDTEDANAGHLLLRNRSLARRWQSSVPFNDMTGNPGPSGRGLPATIPGKTTVMSSLHRLLAAALVLGSLCFLPGTTHAAQSYDSCTGFIDSVPTTISKAGVWCLRKDLSTNVSSGAAITIAANNVTIDCNDFKLGGLAAGNGSKAKGVHADTRQNVVVRHCSVRGFSVGINLYGGAGHLVEDNRLDNNLEGGIYIVASSTLVQRNRVYDTGGAPETTFTYGIYVMADVIDNTVEGVFAATANGFAYGIVLSDPGTLARNNHVSGLVPAGTGKAFGVFSSVEGMTLDGNQIISTAAVTGAGISGVKSACRNNFVSGFSTAAASCLDVGGNVGF